MSGPIFPSTLDGLRLLLRLEKIAHEVLGIPSLTLKGDDSDWHELHVIKICSALRRAYDEGRQSVRASENSS